MPVTIQIRAGLEGTGIRGKERKGMEGFVRKGKEKEKERKEDSSVCIWPETIPIRAGLEGYGRILKERKGKQRRKGKENWEGERKGRKRVVYVYGRKRYKSEQGWKGMEGKLSCIIR